MAMRKDNGVKSAISLEVKNNIPTPSQKGIDVNLPNYVRAYIFQAVEKEAQAGRSEENKSDWQLVARVLDRLFLSIFMVIMVVISVLNYIDYRNK